MNRVIATIALLMASIATVIWQIVKRQEPNKITAAATAAIILSAMAFTVVAISADS